MRRVALAVTWFWIAAIGAFVVWWHRTTPRRRPFPARWVEPEDGVQVDPWPSEIVWGEHTARLIGLGHDRLPHRVGEWTDGCRRCCALIEAMVHDIRNAR